MLQRTRQPTNLHVDVPQHTMPVRLIMDLYDRFKVGHRFSGELAGIDQRQVFRVRTLAITSSPVSTRQIQARRVIFLILINARQQRFHFRRHDSRLRRTQRPSLRQGQRPRLAQWPSLRQFAILRPSAGC